MLVLTRKLGESICINDDIKIIIQSIQGNQVRVGISAPKDATIHREEIYQRIQKENKQASALPMEIEPVRELFRAMREKR